MTFLLINAASKIDDLLCYGYKFLGHNKKKGVDVYRKMSNDLMGGFNRCTATPDVYKGTSFVSVDHSTGNILGQIIRRVGTIGDTGGKGRKSIAEVSKFVNKKGGLTSYIEMQPTNPGRSFYVLS